ncbi:hypothetical protein AB6A40_003327 [Gnathostoma spinigerum]|uniref:EndoU domain-containing protein n=1 Tax=Gnathostoma spinigerum TaxID=75299 RepID=A0ABD6EI29_9BILA
MLFTLSFIYSILHVTRCDEIRLQTPKDFQRTTTLTIPDFNVSNREILDLVNTLRAKDFGMAKPDQIRLNYQRHTTTTGISDDARERLFQYVDQRLLQQPTYRKFIALLDNYDPRTGITEYDSLEEKTEIMAFMDAVTSTEVWKELYNFFKLKVEGHPYASTQQTFRDSVHRLWFDSYSRAAGRMDTSGFEHTFVGEFKNNEVVGAHNWIRFYELERNKSSEFDYKGFLVKRFKVMAAVKFSWRNKMKKSTSFLVGSSPEFDFALYTLCFLTRRKNVCEVEINGCPLSVKSYPLYQNNKAFIGSIYPSAGALTNECRRRNLRF